MLWLRRCWSGIGHYLPGVFSGDDVTESRIWRILLKCLGLRNSKNPYKTNIYNPSMAWSNAMRSLQSIESVWSVIILIFLSSHPIYEILSVDREWDEHKLVDVLLECMIPIHYVLCYVYYCTDHMDQFTRRDGGQGYEFSTIISRPCRMNPNVLSCTCMCSSLCVTVASVINYDDKYFLWFMLQRAIGFAAMSLNIFSLAYIFWKHINAIQSYADVIRDNRIAYTQITLASFITNIIELRESLRVTKSLFSNMVSSSVILCGIVMGIVVNSESAFGFKYWVYVSLVSFSFLYSFLLFIIWQVAESKEHIQRVIHGSAMARRYLTRDSENRTRNRILETATSVDWWILKTELDKKWLEFMVMGIPIHNGTFVKQVVTTIALLQVFGRGLISSQVGDAHNTE